MLVKYAGRKIKVGAREMICPPLSFNQLKKFKDAIREIRKLEANPDTVDESVELAFPIIHAALTRNYPELALEEFGDEFDVHQYHGGMSAMFGLGGDGDLTMGEAEPVAAGQ